MPEPALNVMLNGWYDTPFLIELKNNSLLNRPPSECPVNITTLG